MDYLAGYRAFSVILDLGCGKGAGLDLLLFRFEAGRNGEHFLDD